MYEINQTLANSFVTLKVHFLFDFWLVFKILFSGESLSQIPYKIVIWKVESNDLFYVVHWWQWAPKCHNWILGIHTLNESSLGFWPRHDHQISRVLNNMAMVQPASLPSWPFFLPAKKKLRQCLLLQPFFFSLGKAWQALHLFNKKRTRKKATYCARGVCGGWRRKMPCCVAQ